MPVLSASLLALLAANPYLDAGKKLLKALEYEKAEAQLELAVQVPTTTVDERREAYHLLVRAKAARGRLDDAEKLYLSLLSGDPHAPPPEEAAPKIRDAFRRAKESLYPKDKVELTQRPLGAGSFEVQLVDPWNAVAALVLVEARQPEQVLPLRERRARVELPPLQPGESRKVWVEARTADGRVLASLGDSTRPLEFSAPALPAAAVTAAREAPAPAPAAAPPVTVAKSKSLLVPTLFTVLTVVALALGTGFGLSAQYESNLAGMATWNDERAARDAVAHRRADVANGAWVATAVLGVGAALAWVW